MSHPILMFHKNFILYLVAQCHTGYAFSLDYTTESGATVEALGRLNKTGMSPLRVLKDT